MLKSFGIAHMSRARRGRSLFYLTLAMAALLLLTGQVISDSPARLDSAPEARDVHEGSKWSRLLEDPDLSQTRFQPQADALGAIAARTSGRVLVTGGGGNIGKHLLRRLLSANVPVTSIDVVFVDEELQDIYDDIPQSRSLLRVIYGDIRDREARESALTPDIVGVINLAAVSRVLWCLENERDCFDVNVRAVDDLLKDIQTHPLNPWFLQASSREVYGNAETFPVTEDAPRKAANGYGASKAQAEEVIERHVVARDANRRNPPLRAIGLRLANVYGGEFDHQERLIPSMMTQALAHRPIQLVGGNQDLDMVHIDDVVNAFVLAVNRLEDLKLGPDRSSTWFRRAKSQFEAMNVASGASTPVNTLLRKILAVTESSSPLQMLPGDNRFPDHFVGSYAKATDVLDYSPRVSLDEGIHRLVTAYLRQTKVYLEHTIQRQCEKSTEYTPADVAALDGCSGTVGALGEDGKIGYLHPDESSGVPGWRDIIDPQVWTFEVNATDEQAPILRFRLDRGSEQWYYNVTEEVHGVEIQQSRFAAHLESSTGHIHLTSASNGRSISISSISSQPTIWRRSQKEQSFRLTPFCCPGKPAPWPFFKEDPLAAAILDHTTEKRHPFTESRTGNLCEKLNASLEKAQDRLDRLSTDALPKNIQEAAIPDGSPAEWRVRHLPACANLCDHPTVCVDTGSCMCTQSSCPPRARFPFASTANSEALSYPPPALNETALLEDDILVKSVNRSNWLNVLRPHAARYFSRAPEFADVHLAQLPDEVQRDRDEDPEKYDKLASSPSGCFSADSALERGVKAVGKNYSSTSLVFVPNYSGTLNFPPIDDWLANAKQNHLPHDFEEKNLVIPFTYDWGICNSYFYSLFSVRNIDFGPVRAIRRGTAWNVMGDLNSNCYRPDQDIVVPSRTCLQDELRHRFGDVASVRPVRQRSNLVFHKARRIGQGHSVRSKISCERPYAAGNSAKLERGSILPSFWDQYPTGKDYLGTLEDTVFCPLPRGTTGWATRTIDVIYAGCIPVLIGDKTHHPFWDILDWTKFSITVDDADLDHLEEVLLGYSWTQLHQLQTNLMLVRDAFLYPSDGSEASSWTKGPFFFAMHGTSLLQQTRFPK